MRAELQPAIEALQRDITDLEQQILETKQVINRLCKKSGIDPLYPDATLTATGAGIVGDSFYGKPITTAAREFLEMKRATTGSGPATARQVYEALIKGGYKFEARDENIALISVRSTLRKNSSIFHRLPNGEYGLLSWYPSARAPRETVESPTKTASRPDKVSRASTPTAKAPAKPGLVDAVSSLLKSGGDWTVEKLRESATLIGNFDGELTPRETYRVLMGLKNRKLAMLVSKGIWRWASQATAA